MNEHSGGSGSRTASRHALLSFSPLRLPNCCLQTAFALALDASHTLVSLPNSIWNNDDAFPPFGLAVVTPRLSSQYSTSRTLAPEWIIVPAVPCKKPGHGKRFTLGGQFLAGSLKDDMSRLLQDYCGGCRAIMTRARTFHRRRMTPTHIIRILHGSLGAIRCGPTNILLPPACGEK
ncbi:hypothetical protein BDR22DRAFT_424314 [Usnea florida]